MSDLFRPLQPYKYEVSREPEVDELGLDRIMFRVDPEKGGVDVSAGTLMSQWLALEPFRKHLRRCVPTESVPSKRLLDALSCLKRFREPTDLNSRVQLQHLLPWVRWYHETELEKRIGRVAELEHSSRNASSMSTLER